MIARLEGGPFDGATAENFGYPSFPSALGMKTHDGLLYMRNLDQNPDTTGLVVYRLADKDNTSALYRYADMTVDPVTTEFEVAAA